MFSNHSTKRALPLLVPVLKRQRDICPSDVQVTVYGVFILVNKRMGIKGNRAKTHIG